jgi:hypothetical protein
MNTNEREFGKAALEPPQSKRFARSGGASHSRQRLDCGGFSAALGARYPTRTPLPGSSITTINILAAPTPFRIRVYSCLFVVKTFFQ